MIINRNILGILRTFLNLQRNVVKNSTPSKLPQLLKKISNEHFNPCEAEISPLDAS